MFPAFVRQGILSTYPDYSAVSHWHKDLEFIVIKKGSMTYNVNGELIELPEGNGIMVNSRQLHYGFSPDRKECEIICILLSPELLSGNEWFYQNYIEPVTENACYPYLYLSAEGWQHVILEKIDRLYSSFTAPKKQEPPHFTLMGEFLSIMKLLYENLDVKNHGSAKSSNDLTSLKSMIAYEHGFCGASYYCETFQKYYGTSPLKYRKSRSEQALIP